MADKTIPVEAEFTLFKKNMKGAKVRGGTRYRCALATLGRMLLPNGGESIEVWISNLSQGGIGLNLDRPLEVGTPLILHLKSAVRAYRLEARVTHATPQADNSWRIGCELLEHLSPEMLDELL